MNQGEPLPIGTSDLYRGLSELLCEQGDLEAAAQHLLTAQKLGEQTALTGWPHRLCVAQARLKEAQGDLDGALALLDEAERLYVRNPLPDRPIAALKARVWVRQGKLTEALGWAREQGLSADDDLSYLREFEHITLARVLIARYKSDREMTLLRRGTAAAGSSPASGGRRRPDGQRDRNPAAASTRSPGAGRPASRSRLAGTRPDPGRAGGLCPHLCG